MNRGGDQCYDNIFFGLPYQVALATIAFTTTCALCRIASKRIGALFSRRTTARNLAQRNMSMLPCLHDEYTTLENPSANPAAPTKKVDNMVSCEGLTGLFNDAMEIHFPEEIIMEILSRLPTRSLFRFRYASKVWKALTSEPYFTRKHLNHAKNNQSSQKFLIAQQCLKDGLSLYCCSLSLVQPGKDDRILGFPSNHRPRHQILCCCDGLVLLCVRGEFLLWNPSTKESIVLPNPNEEHRFQEGAYKYGLGYDSTSDDYKILSITAFCDSPQSYCEILALKSGSWRNIDKHPHTHSYRLLGTDSLAFLHGVFHWIGANARNYYVVSFSISNESYGEIALPPLSEGTLIFGFMDVMRLGLSILGGLLCAYCTYYRSGEGGTFKLWGMKDYGVKESWTKLLTQRDPDFNSVIPKYRFADGDVLFCYEEFRKRGFRTSKGPFGSWPRSLSTFQ